MSASPTSYQAPTLVVESTETFAVTQFPPLPVTHVDVPRAERAFNELSRRLTLQSTRQPHRLRLSDTTSIDDVEKGVGSLNNLDDPAPFDLREYLTASNDEQQQAGIKHKHVGITWEDLQVQVDSTLGHKVYAQTLTTLDFWLNLLSIKSSTSDKLFSRGKTSRTILHRFSGVLKPGEMCLVLGNPGSGCTTFLKAIANQRREFSQVSGDVRYAGMGAEEMAKHYKGEVVYNGEEDLHLATLTVAQTLSFVLSTKTPGPKGRLPGVTHRQFQETVQNTLLRMLNIAHTPDTLVGNEFIRGVSGGERKRVSIAEMMATSARVQCWDNSTKGLDASTALDFVKCLRIMTDVLGQTTFVSLYQAGEGIYELFDKVMVLDHGRQIYFGPANEARAYFTNLGFYSPPRQTTADFLTCMDRSKHQPKTASGSNLLLHTADALENVYLSSSTCGAIRESLEEYKGRQETEKTDQEAFRAAVADAKKKGVSKKSPYTLGYFGQIRALTVRQFQLRMQDKFQLVTSMLISIALGLIIGGAYFDQPLSSSGAFTRTGVVFSAMLMTCLDTFGELPTQMDGRPILQKQTSYSLYRPSAYVLGNTLADLPFSAIRILIYDILVYFMSNLDRSGGGFWTFHLFNYLIFLYMQGFFRTLALTCPNFEGAFRMSIFFLPLMIQYIGYMIPVTQMKRWLFWIYYLNPVGYAYAGCVENEMMRVSFTCDGSYIVPRNPPGVDKYQDGLGPNQACTLYGSNGGQSIVSGRSYASIGYGLNVSDIWRRNLVVLLGFTVLYQITQVLAIEFFPQYLSGPATRIHIKETTDTKKRNEILREKGRQIESFDADLTKRRTMFLHRKTFTWERLNYHVPVSGGSRRLLHDVYGYVKPGTLTALMGASGAGKTTCLDVLAQRKNIGIISGELLVDGRPLNTDFARKTAYAEQMDVHEGTSTVREAMRFSAYLRQPVEIPQEEKDDYVEEMIQLLELQEAADVMVSTLGAEVRKRVTIGVELSSRPELLLFLDEPTSGLDTQSAWNIVRILRKLADQGQAILCTIHQPSSILFETFDRLLLLERGGETVYFGDIGSNSSVIVDYFARNGAHCPPNVNPAEYMLEAIGAGVTPCIGNRDWKDIWLESPEHRHVLEEIAIFKETFLAQPRTQTRKARTYATSFFYQLRCVVHRNFSALWRSPDYIYSRLLLHIAVPLFISLAYLQMGNSVRELQYRAFALFWVSLLPTVIMTQLQPMFLNNRKIFFREASSRMYTPTVFAISQLIGEIPCSLACAIVYWVLLIYPSGFGQGSAGRNGTGFQLLVIIFVELFGVTMGQGIAALFPSVQVAVLINPCIGVVLCTFCGVAIPYANMASFWKSWLYQLDPYTRALSASLSTEMHGLVVRCKPDEFAVYDPPKNQTCQQWSSEFISAFGGYLDNANDTLACRYCQYSSGDEFLAALNIQFDHRWRDAFILFGFFVSNIVITILACNFLRHGKR